MDGCITATSSGRLSHRGRFPWSFPLSAWLLCLSWSTYIAPLRLQTFSNLDHHFIRHDGFVVNKRFELGRTDTINFDNNAFNSFRFSKKNNQVIVKLRVFGRALYTSGDGKFQLRSAAWAALGHTIGFKWRSSVITIRTLANDSFELSTGEGIYKTGKDIKKGITGWNLFKDESLFINSAYYNDENLSSTLKNIIILRDDVSKKEAGDLKYFISSRLFDGPKDWAMTSSNCDQATLGLLLLSPTKLCLPGALVFGQQQEPIPPARHDRW